MDTTFREVLSQMSQTDSVRLLLWFLSAAAMSGAGPTCSVSEVLTSVTTSELAGIIALVSMSSPACRVSTLPPVPLASDIPAAGTPVGQPFFAHNFALKCKEWNCSPSSTPEGQSCKRSCVGTEEGSVSYGQSTPPIQLVASHSPKQLEPKVINLPSNPVKAATSLSDRLAVEALVSTRDHDRDSVVEVSGDDANQSGDESNSSSDLLESAADSGPKTATVNCPMCSDTEEAAINSACKKLQKKAWASCMSLRVVSSQRPS